jgi:divalent metal cation (Fe/Co/Zn/Cd) transporter
METVMLNLKSFAQDKANHYFYGSNIAALAAGLGLWIVAILMLWGLIPASTVGLLFTGNVISIVVTAAFAGWKEWIHDAAHPETNTVDRADFWATVAGCVPITVILVALATLHAFINN